ncbi:hypothetical protein MMC34_006956 [Xylographa carneopallida]|nr:hypothetical protein [Xylographa carneopallida]
MDSYEVYRSPSVKAEPRWAPPEGDSYRRRSPGKIVPRFTPSSLISPGSLELNESNLQLNCLPKLSDRAKCPSTSCAHTSITHPNDCLGPHDRRGGYRGSRNRSRSPVAIDRYQPGDRPLRDDFYGHSRDREDRRRVSTPPANPANIDRYVPGQDSGVPQIRVNPLQNPLGLDFQVGFNWFAEWWRVEQQIKEDKERAKNGGRRPSDWAPKGDSREERDKERAQIQAAYDGYKEELQVKMAKAFVQQHKSEEWFKERYVPEVHDPFRHRLTEFRRIALAQWDRDLESGTFDDFTLEGIYKTESNGAGGIVEREEGETVAAAEVLGVGDLVASRGGDIRDESAQQPALLIKTLAPMVSREKIEAFCKEHLGEQDGGFKWLSLSDPNPLKKCHRIGWIMLHPGADVDMIAERGDGRDEEDEGYEEGTQPEVKANLLTPAEKALDAINGKTIYDETRGDFTCHVGVHVSPKEPRKKALWDLFSAPERIDRDLKIAKRLVSKYDQELGEDADGVGNVAQRVEDLRLRGILQPLINGTSNVKKSKKGQQVQGMDDRDMEDVEGDGDLEDGEEEEEGAYDEETDDEDLLVKKKNLDLLVEYLRRVYNFCFFCVFESDSVHELIRKCAGGHLRRPRASLSTAAKTAARASAFGQPFPLKRRESNPDDMQDSSPIEEKKFHNRNGSKNDMQLQRAFNWVKTYEEKLLQILEPENVDVRKLGGTPLEEGLDEELKKYVKQEDESKFRCKVPECTKLFKGEVFWKKHVEKRHPEWFQGIKQDLNLVNTYVLDPSHIAPSRSDANSNGHFPINTHNMQAGTPRGFNLASMPMMSNFPPGFIPPVGFPPFPSFGNHAVQIPGGWAGGGPPMMMEGDGMHQAGPMRRGAGRFQTNRSGPYDRRQPRYGNNNGRLSPQRGGFNGMGPVQMGGRIGGGGGKWGDGAGAQTVGPREAVQGRSLKSYEDLDAVTGAGGGELNY